MEKRHKHRTSVKTCKFAKSSPEARRLIRAALRGRSWRQAAAVLKLPNAAQAQKMLAGTIRDTPSMKAAIKRADARAKRAWLMVKDDHIDVDCAQMLSDVKEVRRRIEIIEANVRAYSEKTMKDVTP